MSELKKVSKEDFEDFLGGYPRPLTSGCTTICDPPFRSYRDESLPTTGEIGSLEYYFDKEVARIDMDWRGPGGEIDKGNTGKYWEYSILNTPAATKTK